MPELEGIPQFLQPCLRLFLSVDIVGSTALKQGKFPIEEPDEGANLSQAGSHWLPDLVTFYQDVDSKFRSHWNNYCNDVATKHSWPKGNHARLWKINGDELIYVQELDSARHAVALLWCWLRACLAFRADLTAKKSKLDVKMTAWTAGFPISNTEIIFNKQKSEDYADWEPLTLHYALIERWHSRPETRTELVQDFIGPTIDTGFRLTGKATPRKFVVSLEVAYILAMTANPGPMSMKLGYDGMVDLKGVFGGLPYPVFWIDAHDGDKLSQAEDVLRGPQHPAFGSIKTFCEEYIDTNNSYLLKPFIYKDPEPLLANVPLNYSEKLLQISNAWERAKQSRAAYENSAKESTTAAPIGTDNLEVALPGIGPKRT